MVKLDKTVAKKIREGLRYILENSSIKVSTRKHYGITANVDADFDVLLFKECPGVEEAEGFGYSRTIKLSFIDGRSLELAKRDESRMKVEYEIIRIHRFLRPP